MSATLRPLQQEIVYERVLPHIANSCYQSPSNPDETFFFAGGLIILPCGYGKTKIVEQIFYELGQHRPNGNRMLVVVPTKAICQQTAIAFRRDLRGTKVAVLLASDPKTKKKQSTTATAAPARRILVAGGRGHEETEATAAAAADATTTPDAVRQMVEESDVVITVNSTLKSRKYDYSFYEYFGAVVFDEVHHMTAPGNSQLFFEMNVPILLGVTAEFENNSKTFGLLEQCIGPRLFEKRFRDGQDDIRVNKCNFRTRGLLDYVVREEPTEQKKEAAKKPFVEEMSLTRTYTKVLCDLLNSQHLATFAAEHIEYMVESIPEDEEFIASMKRLKPKLAPIDDPDLCTACAQESVFLFPLVGEAAKAVSAKTKTPSPGLCSNCVTDIYKNHNNCFRFVCKKEETEEEEVVIIPNVLPGAFAFKEETTAATKHAVTTTTNATAAAPKKGGRGHATGKPRGGGDESKRKRRKNDNDDEEDDDEDDDEANYDFLQNDSRLAERLQESLDRSRDVYESTYFGVNQILVLCDQVVPLELLALRIRQRMARAPDIGFLAGKKVSMEDINSARGKQLILATMQRAKEGMDIPTINTVMFLSPSKSIRQSMGRALRTSGEKRVYDFIYYQRVFWVQFEKSRKPEYDAHKCKFVNFKLPRFLDWLGGRSDAGEEEEVQEGEEGELAAAEMNSCL